MDFGKENRLSPEEMVRAYEETCAKGLNIRSLSLSLFLSKRLVVLHSLNFAVFVCFAYCLLLIAFLLKIYLLIC